MHRPKISRCHNSRDVLSTAFHGEGTPSHRLAGEAHDGVAADGGVRHVAPDAVDDAPVALVRVAAPE